MNLTQLPANSYRWRVPNLLCERVPIAGKRLLEVGGDRTGLVARELIKRGAASVTITNIVDHLPENVARSADAPAGEEGYEGRIHYVTADARKLEDSFEPGHFDAAYGIAVIEHIPDTEIWLDSMRKVIRKGGMACIDGGPIWSGPFGHHLWVKTGKATYQFSDSSNPLPNWSHLYLNEEEMGQMLMEKGLDMEAMQKIRDWVYRSGNINRVPYSKILKAVDRSGVIVLEQQERGIGKPPLAIREKLRKSCGPEKFQVTGLTLLLKYG